MDQEQEHQREYLMLSDLLCLIEQNSICLQKCDLFQSLEERIFYLIII